MKGCVIPHFKGEDVWPILRGRILWYLPQRIWISIPNFFLLSTVIFSSYYSLSARVKKEEGREVRRWVFTQLRWLLIPWTWQVVKIYSYVEHNCTFPQRIFSLEISLLSLTLARCTCHVGNCLLPWPLASSFIPPATQLGPKTAWCLLLSAPWHTSNC